MNSPEASPAHLAGQARQVFVRHVIDDLPQVAQRLLDDLQARAEQAHYSEAAQRVDDARVRLMKSSAVWLERSRDRLTALLKAREEAPRTAAGPLSLVDEELVENQILAARAALVAVDKGNEPLNELRLRLQRLELTDELDKRDPVLATNVTQAIVSAWMDAGLNRSDWQICQITLHNLLAKVIMAGYQEANQFLLARGVLPEIDLRDLVRRGGRAGPEPSVPSVVGRGQVVRTTPFSPSGLGSLTHVVPLRHTSGGVPLESTMAGVGWSGSDGGAPNGHQLVMQRLSGFMASRVPGWGASGPVPDGGARVQGGAATSDAAVATGGWWVQVPLPPADWSSVEAGARGARAQAQALKQAARSDTEKALIEMVALIFDGILGEDRIPASVRVWFARLQMPVLRHALQDATFLTAEDHPARQLIDRMGACVLGFDPAAPLQALEGEIKRIVQVIEQYPETGRRVFELMLQEFEQFLARAVTEEPRLKRATDVASQLEQRGALTVQYTIELRRLLGSAPVHEALRTFLFQTWVEVMAHASVAYGADDERARRARELAADLLWAASAKPSRHERAQVIARVPGLMAQIREGLAWIGLDAEAQDRAVQPVSEALAAAFVSRAPAVDAGWLAGLTQSLGRLEAVLTDNSESVPLNRDSLEWLTGQDASGITVLPDVESATPPHLRSWAQALPLGSWYTLEHNGVRVAVQLTWASPRRQLYLFVAGPAGAYLMQQGRVGQYLKAGLLRASQAEPLTRQATRQALDKLQANPERLLA